MRLHLQRFPPGPEATEGRLVVDGADFCATLEPQTPIPAGTYPVTLYHSPRFGREVPLLHDVPGHTFIEIHCGNSALDTKNCVLVALDGGRPDDNWIARSLVAFDELVPKLRAALDAGSPVSIRIEDATA